MPWSHPTTNIAAFRTALMACPSWGVDEADHFYPEVTAAECASLDRWAWLIDDGNSTLRAVLYVANQESK